MTNALMPVLDFLDQLINDYWELLFFAFVFACLTIIAWVLSGGMRRKGVTQETAIMIVPIIGCSNNTPTNDPPPFPASDDHL